MTANQVDLLLELNRIGSEKVIQMTQNQVDLLLELTRVMLAVGTLHPEVAAMLHQMAEGVAVEFRRSSAAFAG